MNQADMDMDINDKAAIRVDRRAQRAALTRQQRQHAAQRVAYHLCQHALFQRAQDIAAYHAVNGELDPKPIIETLWQQNKTCYLPILHPEKSQRLWFIRYEKDTPLHPNRFTILEPEYQAENCREAKALDLVLLPLVAFDNQGNRLGMGAGFYDRAFSFCKHIAKPLLIGLAYEFQCTEHISPDPWDVPMAGVVTENGLKMFNRA